MDSHNRILSLPALSAILNPRLPVTEALSELVREAKRLTASDHVFLSQYDRKARFFSSVAFDSLIAPTNVSLEQKFRGEQYASLQTVFIPDLPYYNFRLRPNAARLGLNAMVGLPIADATGLIGLLECFSHNMNHYSEQDVFSLSLLAKQAGLLLEKQAYTQAGERWQIENAFLYELQELEHASDGMLLYRFGEKLAALFKADGLAVFGLEPTKEYDLLQEVFANGFSMNDIQLLKDAFSRDFLNQALLTPTSGGKPTVIRQPLGASEGRKLINIVPIAIRTNLHGMVVYYWRQIAAESQIRQVEEAAARLIQHVANVLEKKAQYNNIQRLTFTDPLTQLGNRRLFDYVLGREFDKVRRNKLPLSLLMIDIDHFKQLNDRHGHLVGDAILEQLGQRLRTSFRSIDCPTRYGGEEFAVILSGQPLEKAVAAAERLRRLIANAPFVVGHQTLPITISIGVATHNPQLGQQYAAKVAFIQAADQALYRAKQQGRNRIVAAKYSEQP